MFFNLYLGKAYESDVPCFFYLRVPDDFSESYIERILRKYFRHKGVDNFGPFHQGEVIGFKFFPSEDYHGKNPVSRLDAFVDLKNLGFVSDCVIDVLEKYSSHRVLDFA